MKKLETKNMVLLKHHLKALKLPTIHAEWEKVANRCAQDNVDHLGFLLQLWRAIPSRICGRFTRCAVA